MKVNPKKFLDARSYIEKINSVSLSDLDVSDWFNGKPQEIQKMKADFELTGLNNATLLTSDYYREYKVRRKRLSPRPAKQGEQ